LAIRTESGAAASCLHPLFDSAPKHHDAKTTNRKYELDAQASEFFYQTAGLIFDI
jgi:hypothetical protein